MTEQERKELIEKMARYIACASSSEDDPESDWCYENWPAYENEARAALAVAEPVIQEQCAKLADNHSAEVKVSKFATATNALCAQKMAKDIAAAIREGRKDETL